MARIPTKRNAPRRTRASIRRKRLPLPRRSSYMEPSAETLASLNEDTSKLPKYRTVEAFFKALEDDTAK